jgi:hypothetical protein
MVPPSVVIKGGMGGWLSLLTNRAIACHSRGPVSVSIHGTRTFDVGIRPCLQGLFSIHGLHPVERPGAARDFRATSVREWAVALGLALSDLAAGVERHGIGETINRRPMASQGISALLAVKTHPSICAVKIGSGPTNSGLCKNDLPFGGS